jgi:hypothetical protein
MKKTVAIPVDVLRRGNPDELADYGDKPMSVAEVEAFAADEAKALEQAVIDAPLKARLAEYPSIGDQLDALWKIVTAMQGMADIPDDAGAVMQIIQDVKQKHPKQVG